MKTAIKKSRFIRAFSTNSFGCSAECHCGVIHYDTANEWDEDHHENTLPNAEKLAEESPEHFQFHDTAIEYLDFNGRRYVIDCKCGMTNFIFEFLNEDKESILTYYKNTQEQVTLADIA